ncbi:MAG: hypothetical protein AB7O24_30410 [Kofleriaceae bacterium]
MRRIVIAWAVLATACGGSGIPAHNGYKSDKLKPWKKPKALKLDGKLEATANGELSYPDMRRAKWFAVELPFDGDLTVQVEVAPAGDGTSDDLDLGVEVVDASYRVLAKSDLEDEDAHELNKTRTLSGLRSGRYLIHLFLQGRTDVADFTLRTAVKRAAAPTEVDLGAHVAFPPALPMVPLEDDSPRTTKPTTTPTVTVVKKKPKDPPPVATLTARIIGVKVQPSGTLITIGRGTEGGATSGMKGSVPGVTGGGFELSACTARTCSATVSATPDQIKASSGSVVLTP